jgi:hypothetical protein
MALRFVRISPIIPIDEASQVSLIGPQRVQLVDISLVMRHLHGVGLLCDSGKRLHSHTLFFGVAHAWKRRCAMMRQCHEADAVER